MTSHTKMTSGSKNNQHGVALLFCLVALLILTAVTTSMIMLSQTETAVNANYRSEEVAFFAAKAGVYEALDRMQQSNATSIACNLPTGLPGATQSIAPGCTTTPKGVLYLVNSGSSLTVQPWTSTNTYLDTELCHEGFTISGMSSVPADVPCSTVPTGSTWYASVNSNYPWSGTAAALPYEWVRINWKQNSSATYISGTGTSAANASYSVNSGLTSTTPVCWNGGSEVLLSTPTGVTPSYNSCEQYQTCAPTGPVITTPVYLITALSRTSNGSRQMVQAEAALNPPTVTVPTCGTSDAYGFFAYGGSCSSPGFKIAGNASVDGFNSANGPYNPVTNASAALGEVGTNGGLVEQGTSTHIGTVNVPNITASAGPPPVYGPGPCPDDFSISGGATYTSLKQSVVIAKPTVNIPANTSTTDKSAGHATNTVMVPGNYRNVTASAGGTITLTAPGVYNIQCLTVGSANSNITIVPPTKAVTINISGNSGCATNPVSFGSNSLINNCNVGSGVGCTVPVTPGIASNLQINYNGTGTLDIIGGPGSYAVINAPNAPVVLHGGANYYGTIMANTIDDSGGVNLHFDTADTTINGNSATTATANAGGSYNTLSFRSVPY
jgi:Tfp pilus assembly protein PilX